jgi:hypothetical protein
MWRRVDIVLTDVSQKRIASIFRVGEKRRNSASDEPARAGANIPHPRIAFFIVTAVKTSNLTYLRISVSKREGQTLIP